MNAQAKKYTCWTAQFCGGGASYGVLEILWRGYTHPSMLIAGGLGFWLLVRITKINCGLFIKSVIGGLGITLVEFVSGCVVNLWLRLSVWDYSEMAMSFLGQICLAYTILWTALSAIIIQLCRYALNWSRYFTEPKDSQANNFVAQILHGHERLRRDANEQHTLVQFYAE